MYFKIALKVIKSQGFTLSLEDAFYQKLQCGKPKLMPAGILGLNRDFLIAQLILFLNNF